MIISDNSDNPVPQDNSHHNPADSSSADPAGQSLLPGWFRTRIDEHAVEIFDPAGFTDRENRTEPEGCVLFLHGHGRIMLSDNAVFTDLFRTHNLVVVCPDGQRSWWLDRVCPEFSPTTPPQTWLLESVVPWISTRWNLHPPAIALLGVSMGGQGVLQLAYRKAVRFPVVAAIAPAVDFHQMHGQGLPLDDMFVTAEEARQATVVLNLHPLAWPKHQFFCCDPADSEWIDGAARLGMKLSSSGILHERDLETTIDGHTWNYFNHMAPKVMDHIARSLASCRNAM